MLEFTVPIYWQQSKKKRVLLGLNWYRNAHYQTLSKAKRDMNELIHEMELTHKFQGVVRIRYEIFLGRKGSDGGNVRSVIEKFVLDSLKKEGVIEDDTFDLVVSDSSEYHLDRENPRAVVTVTDLT